MRVSLETVSNHQSDIGSYAMADESKRTIGVQFQVFLTEYMLVELDS